MKDLKQPALYLCRKDFSIISDLSGFVSEVELSLRFSDADELSFTVHREMDRRINPCWNDLVNLRLIYVPELKEYFEIEVNEQESPDQVKQITAQSLCESELSNLNVTLEVNTDLDIAAPGYVPTVLYRPDQPAASLLHRILKDKAPHYSIGHVDDSLASLQRTFSIDSNIDDFLRQELAPEIDAHVEYNTVTRSISLYDMLSVCGDCGHRESYYDVCPVCGSANVKNGFGEWTNVYLSADNLVQDISLTAGKDHIKNSFKVIGGDDVITNLIPAVNPNGTGYLTKFSALQYGDMPDELAEKLKAYTALCDSRKEEYRKITLEICECLDKILYYQSGMVPPVPSPETDAAAQLHIATKALNDLMAEKQAPNTIGISAFGASTSVSTVNKAILSYVEQLLSPGYEASVTPSSYTFSGTCGIWQGILHVRSAALQEDCAASSPLTLKIDGNAMAYVTQKLRKVLSARDLEDRDYDFSLYSVDALQGFIDAYEACESILVDHGDAGKSPGSPQYALYEKYRERKAAAVAQQKGKQSLVEEWTEKKELYASRQKAIHDALDLQNYLGEKLFLLYCAYRRDDKYENRNYISDGLSDADLLRRAENLLETAQRELDVACENQYSLTASLDNLFLLDEFAPFHDKCRLGNWIYARVNDSVFSLRLIEIGISYDEPDKVTVQFSNVQKAHSPAGDIGKILKEAGSIAASYPATVKQLSEDARIISQVSQWVDKGLDATNTMIANSPVQNTVLDENGIWCRGYDELTGEFEPLQLRIVNSTLAVTDDNWKTARAAIGRYALQDPVTGEIRYAMGVIGETIVGKLLLGEKLGIYNSGQSMTFDQDGLCITNGQNTFSVRPGRDFLSLTKSGHKLFYVDNNGMLHIGGDGAGLDLSLNRSIGTMNEQIATLSTTVSGISAKVENAVSISTFEQTAREINASIRSKVDSDKIISKINLSEEGARINGEKIELEGLVRFSSLDEGLQKELTEASSKADDAKAKTDGLARGTTVIDGGCIETGSVNADLITTGTLDARKVNVINVKAASVDAENITGTTIRGKKIVGGSIEGTSLNGCAGSFTSVFIHNKDHVGDFQYGSICGQFTKSDGTVKQYEVMRVNNMENHSDMFVYQPMYFQNEAAQLILHAHTGLRFGSIINSDHSLLPAYINTLGAPDSTGRTGIRMGFLDTNFSDGQVPGLEVYDDYDLTTHSHAITAKVFGNLEVSGVIADQSSIKYKTNVQPLTDQEALRLLDYHIVSFDYRDGRLGRHGMIAEDAAKISEYAVIKDTNGEPDAISYTAFIPDLIRLNQLFYTEIQDLKQQIQQLKDADK